MEVCTAENEVFTGVALNQIHMSITQGGLNTAYDKLHAETL